MKFLALAILASIITATSAFAETNVSTCRELIASGNEEVKHVNDRFNVGEVTRTDVANVELDLLQVRYECRDILAKDYCSAAIGFANQIVAGVQEEARAGQRTTLEVIVAKKALIKLNGLCR